MADAWETAVGPPTHAGKGIAFQTNTRCTTTSWVLCNEIGGRKMYSLEVDTTIETSLAKIKFNMKKLEQNAYFQDELWFFVSLRVPTTQAILHTALPNNSFGQKTIEKMKSMDVGAHAGVGGLGPAPTASIGVDAKMSRGQNLSVSVNDFEVRKIQRHPINGTEWNLALRYLPDGEEYDGNIYNQKSMLKRTRKTKMEPVSQNRIPVAAEHGFEQKVSNVWQISESLLNENVKLEVNVLRRIRKTNANHFVSVCETFEADILLKQYQPLGKDVVRVPTSLMSKGSVNSFVQKEGLLISYFESCSKLPEKEKEKKVKGNKELNKAQEFLMDKLSEIVHNTLNKKL